MKKMLAIILAVAMCVGMATVSFGINVDYTIDHFSILGSDGEMIDVDAGGNVAYVNGDTFYVIPYANDQADSNIEITSAEITQGSTTVYTPAFYFDDEGNNPTNVWMVQMKTQDIAAVKDYDTVLHVEGVDANGNTYSGDLTLVVKDYGTIDANDINTARINDTDVDTLDDDGNYRYVVSADAFEAINSGETFAFPYDGYTLHIGSGISNALNFRASTERIDNLVERYGEDKILGFLDFKDKNDLPVSITVEMECTEYSSTHVTNQAYVYRVEGDGLTLVTDNATYDSSRSTVTFETNKLGSLVISAEPLTDETTGETTTDTSTDSSTTTTDSDKANPDTGANDVIGLAVAGAVVAAAAGFVALKKK